MAWLALGPLRRVVPIRLLAERREVRAYGHPRPSYPLHVLIVPRRRVPDYLLASPSLLADVLDLTAELSRERGAPVDLVTNLGHYQEVKLLHFHVIPAAGEVSTNEVATERVEELLAATTSEARTTLASAGQARVVLTPTTSSVRWRVA